MDERRSKRPTRARFSDDASDLLLVKRIVHADRDALWELYATYYHPLLRLLFRMTGHLDLAREAINDVMLIVWTNAGFFGGRSAVATWILGIAYRKALQALATSHQRPSRAAGVPGNDWGEPSDAATDFADDVDPQDLLEETLSHLSPAHRATVELTYFYGCSCDEIAAIVGCPVATVEARMAHARTKLERRSLVIGRDGSLSGQLETHDHALQRLPWLVNGSLVGNERDAVERHMRDCLLCRRELRAQRHLRDAIVSQPDLHISAYSSFDRLSRRLDQRPSTAAHGARSAWNRGTRDLTRFAFVGVVGTLLLALLWLALPRNGAIIVRSDHALATMTPAEYVALDIAFVDSISAAQMQDVLSEMGAEITAGPSRLGRYTVRLLDRRPTDAELDDLAGRLSADPRVRFAAARARASE